MAKAKHKVTQEDLTENPEGIHAGDEIDVPEDSEIPDDEIKIPEDVEISEGPIKPKHFDQAKIIFDSLSHIQTIWFEDNGAWHYHERVGTTPIQRADTID